MGRGMWAEPRRVPCKELPDVPPSRVLEHATFTQNDVWQQAWSTANLGNSPEPWCPGILMGFVHLDLAACWVADLSFQPLWRSSRSCGDQSPHPKPHTQRRQSSVTQCASRWAKTLLSGRTFQELRNHLLEAEDKCQPFLWVKLILYWITRPQSPHIENKVE